MAEISYNALKPDTIIFGETLYRDATAHIIGLAQKELLIFDQDLVKGGYASVARFEQLSTFLGRGPQNRLTMVLQDSGYFIRHCPRLFGLLKTYGHAMTVYETNDQAKVAKDVFIIADGQHYLRRFHIDQPRFRYASDDPETVGMLGMRFEELLEATSHSVATGSVGL